MPILGLSEATLRGRSSEDLRKNNREDQIAHGSWTTLEYFMAITVDAYMAGLTCRIPSLHLIAWGGPMEDEILAICAMFSDALPSHFRLALRPAHVDYLAALFYERAELFSSLSSLELRLDLADMPFDFKSFLDTIGTALQRLSIASLQVEIKCLTHLSSKRSESYCRSIGTPRATCYTLEAMANEEIEGRMRYFLKKVPTLRRVTIAWGQCVFSVPNHVITMDLDSVPHISERVGRPGDKYWQDGYHNWGIAIG
ncbi:hypothetical protein GSI_11869 [Ganoderma sinense ZZ0214-1]|uniref:Uncharacterized protein n=1 Tax=Ganoderma sinense ZZ0214-1 TaxID=1077348 RepID=A0A2G8RX67_9APHY|nr:hypothetical protein GSI_11869 [Ganoderma sinense ZZ0214-1]